MMGFASGVTSYSPAHACEIAASASAGRRRIATSITCGRKSHCTVVSNVGASSLSPMPNNTPAPSR